MMNNKFYVVENYMDGGRCLVTNRTAAEDIAKILCMNAIDNGYIATPRDFAIYEITAWDCADDSIKDLYQMPKFLFDYSVEERRVLDE